MRKGTMRNFLTLLLLAAVLLSCDTHKPSRYHGALYFAQGAYLMRFSLGDSSLAVTGHLGDTTIREISALDADQLLVAETAIVNRLRVPRITLFNTQTGESADLYSGVLARYLANPGVVVYDDGSDLFAVPRWEDSANKVLFSHPKNQLTRMIEAAPGMLLFEAGEAGHSLIRSWNALTGELTELYPLTATCRLQGAVWIGSLERLACKPRDVPTAEGRYILSSLDGVSGAGLELPNLNQFLALTYIAGQDAIVLQESWRGRLDQRENYAVWVYDVRTHDSQRIADEINLGESVAFLDY